MSNFGSRLSDWQRQVSALQSSVITMRASGQICTTGVEAYRLRNEIAERMQLLEREFDNIEMPALRRTQTTQLFHQLIVALEQLGA